MERKDDRNSLSKLMVSPATSSTVVPTVTSSPPAISVIIPMYNAEAYVGECLESVLLQTFQDFEVIVVDDCSTDNSFKVVEEYAPKFNGRLTLTKTEENSGGGGYIPRNIGFKMARGEYVYFLDADDFILLTALETLYKAAKDYDAEVVYTSVHYKITNPNDVYLERDYKGKNLLIEGKEDELTLMIDSSNEILRQLTQGENFRNPWTKLIRRDFLLEHGILFPETSKLINGGDFIWCVNVYACAKKFLRFPTPLYFYRTYNDNSVSFIKREPQEQISCWFVGFVAWLKALSELTNKLKVLKENPGYFFGATKNHFNWCLSRTLEARKELTNQDIYEILRCEFSDQSDLSNFALPFFLSIIDENKKLDEQRLQTIGNLNKKIVQIKDSLVSPATGSNVVVPNNTVGNPAISVIIPLYNVEEYIGECLDSLLAQTFQDFEVIIVDDCSTDSSCAIVESYMPEFNKTYNMSFTREDDSNFNVVENYALKFNDRLKLYHTEKNSGTCAVPRNKAIPLSRGEYIKLLDADDMLTKTALQEMYSLAKRHDADVVYCTSYYLLDNDGTNLSIKKRDRFIDKPPIRTQDFKKYVDQMMLDPYFWGASWLSFVRRSFILENEIFFPPVKPSEDRIWYHKLFFFAKTFLSVPNTIYFYRNSVDSIVRTKRTPQEKVVFQSEAVLFGIKFLDKSLSQHEFFKSNPSYRYNLLKRFINNEIIESFNSSPEVAYDEIYLAMKDKFGDRFGEYDVLIPALYAALCSDKYALKLEKDKTRILNKLEPYFTGRVDIKLNSTEGDFQILSISDREARIDKPAWLCQNGVGYMLQSCAGKLEFVAKSTVAGKISLNLRGKDVRSPEDWKRGIVKRIPYWIDYTALTVNGKKLLDKATPVWHDKPYACVIETKAGEELKIQMEWLPHRGEPAEQKVAPVVAKSPIPVSFKPFLTARVDIKLDSTEGDFQILSVSDREARIDRATWLCKDGVGYMLQSYAGKLEFATKANVTGKVHFWLRGVDVRDPKDKSKRIPYWIDYTAFTVNGKKLLDEVTLVWHDKPYACVIETKAGEELKIQLEWLPHRGEPAEQKVAPTIGEISIPSSFKPFLTARIDIKLNSTEGDFKILSKSDSKADVSKPSYFQKNGTGYVITSLNGKLTFVAESTVDGQIKFNLRGLEVRDPKDWKKGIAKRIPYWVDYTKFTVNNEVIFDKLTPAWCDEPYNYKMNVNAGEKVRVHVEWLPHRSDF